MSSVQGEYSSRFSSSTIVSPYGQVEYKNDKEKD